MIINVLIERGKDGTYGAYIDGNNPLRCGIIGDGKTAEEAKRNFMDGVRSFKEDGFIPDNVRFEFSYDITSFLNYYSQVLTLAGLSRLTGVAQGQLSHYMTGRRHPSAKTVEKMQKAINDFGKDLSIVHFV